MKGESFIVEPERFASALFLIFLGLFLGLCLLMIWPFFQIIGWAIVLAIISHPLHFFLTRKLRHRTLAAATTLSIVCVCILLPASFLIVGIVQQANSVAKVIQSYVEKEQYKNLFDPERMPLLKKSYNFLVRYVDLSQLDLQEILQDSVKQIGSFLGRQGFEIVKNVVLFFVQAGLSLVIFFFLLRDGNKILDAVKQFLPLSEQETNLVLLKARDTIRATVFGWLAVGIVQGTLLGMIFGILHLPSALFWGAVTVVLCFIPFVGAPFVWVPATILLLANGLWWKAVVLGGFGVVVINLTDNFLRPLLVGNRLNLHPMITFFSIFGGLLLMGPLGLVLGPVIVAVTLALLDILSLKLKKEENVIEEKKSLEEAND